MAEVPSEQQQSSLPTLVTPPTNLADEGLKLDSNTVGYGCAGFLFGLSESSPWLPLALVSGWQVASEFTRGAIVSAFSPYPPARRGSLLTALIDVSATMAGWYVARKWSEAEAARSTQR